MSFWLHLFFNRSYNIQIISAYLLGARLGWCLVYNYNRKAEIKAQNWEQVHRRPIYIEYIFHIFLKTFVSFPPIWHPIFCLPPSKSRRGKGAPAEEEPSHTDPNFIQPCSSGEPIPLVAPFPWVSVSPRPQEGVGSPAGTWTAHTAFATSPETLERWLCFILFKKNS